MFSFQYLASLPQILPAFGYHPLEGASLLEESQDPEPVNSLFKSGVENEIWFGDC